MTDKKPPAHKPSRPAKATAAREQVSRKSGGTNASKPSETKKTAILSAPNYGVWPD